VKRLEKCEKIRVKYAMKLSADKKSKVRWKTYPQGDSEIYKNAVKQDSIFFKDFHLFAKKFSCHTLYLKKFSLSSIRLMMVSWSEFLLCSQSSSCFS